ncbi:MAG: non-canonical purine NTP pyrophosphatase, RdgB/HAM1 family [Chloroflexi bacterium RBG_13_50_10]|nr:MAG: non-canonical purine NTP pyrophosphatase, RdgB/HAM1 family [Chloroflexi bacterium RBG_13_50_10]
MPKLLLATTNRGKVREYRHLLSGLPFELVTPDEMGIDIPVEEKHLSYEENARTKATAYAGASHVITLADDSGVEVDALGGEPGIRSARAAGEEASDKDRVEHLLSRLKDVPWGKRTARFKCVIAIATPEGKTELCHGECQGLIALAPKGENGFGYDPVFYLPEFKKTMAELPLDRKNQISHRGRAARKAYRVLERLAEKVKL